MLGQQIEILSDGMEHSGVHTITWDAKDLPAGVYLVHLQTAGLSETKKIVILNKGLYYACHENLSIYWLFLLRNSAITVFTIAVVFQSIIKTI